MAIAALNALRFNYALTEGAPLRRRLVTRGGARQVRDAPCPVCKFKTQPPHDARKHRGQGKRKRAFTSSQLNEMGLAKV